MRKSRQRQQPETLGLKRMGAPSPYSSRHLIGTTIPKQKEQPRLQPMQPVHKKKRNKKKIIKRTLLLIIIIALGVVGWDAWKFIKDANKIFGGNILGLFTATQLKGESQGRVNILLAGDSIDDPGHKGAALTDSIMIISINTKKNTAFLLSVPRDLYVNIPNFGNSKINAAYEFGKIENFSQPGFPNGGMGLLEQVITRDFHIPIDYYALIDYGAVRDAVNAVGGITVNIQSSDPRGLYDPSIDYATGKPLVDLSNGYHTLNGEQALDLARARGDAYGSYGFGLSDFQRTQDQRMMLIALKQKALSIGVLSNPLKLGKLFDSFGNNVNTDIKTIDVRAFYQVVSKIHNNNIKSIGLNNVNGTDMLTNYVTPHGQDALIPKAGMYNYSAIQAYIQQLLKS